MLSPPISFWASYLPDKPENVFSRSLSSTVPSHVPQCNTILLARPYIEGLLAFSANKLGGDSTQGPSGC
ncbi:hypothetical protein GN956_G20071 [Arapaima gigas]